MCSIKIPSRTGLRWLLLLADLYTNVTGCRLLLRKMEFCKIVSKAVKKLNSGVKCWQFERQVVWADPLVQIYRLQHCLWDFCVPLFTLNQTTELSPLSSPPPPKYLLWWESLLWVRSGEMKWNEDHESLMDHREVPLKGCQRWNISYGEEDHRAGSEWKEIWYMRISVSYSLPQNWSVFLVNSLTNVSCWQ